jgi:hypothetical protein
VAGVFNSPPHITRPAYAAGVPGQRPQKGHRYGIVAVRAFFATRIVSKSHVTGWPQLYDDQESNTRCGGANKLLVLFLEKIYNRVINNVLDTKKLAGNYL